MNRRMLVAIVLLLFGSLVGMAEDYTHFPALPDEQKEKIVWDLFDRHQFGKPEHKPIVRDLLETQGRYTHANKIGFLSAAIAIAQRQGWKEFRPLIKALYDHPTDVFLFEAAFRYLRASDKRTIPVEVTADTDLLIKSTRYCSTVTDAELVAVRRRLINQRDKEAVLVYCLYAAGHNVDKGATLTAYQRRQQAIVAVLLTLERKAVRARLKTLPLNFHDIGVRDFDDG